VQFQFKICGLTSVDDAVAAVDAGADAIGLNFYSGSKRCVGADVARQIVMAVGARATMVGVFVNSSAADIHRLVAETGIHAIQLHGDEPPELIRALGSGCPVVRARRLDEKGTAAIAADLAACIDIVGVGPAAVLIDAAAAGQFGGSGEQADWSLLTGERHWLGGVPLVLAGGLTRENVAEAIRSVRPAAVDVASGVESSPGKKDQGKMREFVAAAREAFAQI
jgi:phosphoribosylanthranilate isomerase